MTPGEQAPGRPRDEIAGPRVFPPKDAAAQSLMFKARLFGWCPNPPFLGALTLLVCGAARHGHDLLSPESPITQSGFTMTPDFT